MGLTSSLSTALTGLTAAETTIDVVGNNLANSNTVGFKASQANFATQFAQTMSLGSAPTDDAGGTNPRQTGLGTMVASITADFTPGTIEISSNPTDMAIQGDGFFIVQGSAGERLYTRNGVFEMNSANELVTITGNRVLGLAVLEASENISGGESLAGPLAASGHFPPMVVEMVAVAEESNTLENVLLDIADSLERRTWRQLDIAVRLIEPIMLLMLAGAVLTLVIALLLPVLRMSTQI